MLRSVAIVIVCLAAPLAAAQDDKPKPDAAPKAGVPRAIKTLLLDRVAPAYQASDAYGVLAALSPAVARWSDKQLEANDALLAENHIPPVRSLLAQARIILIGFGGATNAPAPKGRELQLTIHGLAGELETFVEHCNKHPALQDPTPAVAGIGEFEQLFWQVHVLNNKLREARLIAEYAGRLAAAATGTFRDDADQQRLAALSNDLDETAKRFAEAVVELRVERVEMAQIILSDSTDLKQRIVAAYALDFDGDYLADVFAQPRQFQRERLKDPDLPERVKTVVADGRQQAGGLLDKSRLFFEGLHWWLRGRYGRGTHDQGLLKHPAAMESREALLTLLMPSDPPKPIDAANDASFPTPTVDRRHHYVWATDQAPRFASQAAMTGMFH